MIATDQPNVHPLEDLLEVYRKHGFDTGYHQSVQDQLAGLVLQAERFLGERTGTDADRKLLYSFVACLERHLTDQSPLTNQGFIDGCGI